MHFVSRQPSERAPARMAPLAVLPVFLDLRGARAVVAGGTDAAAWKAELLAAAGAEVHVYDVGAKIRVRADFAPSQAGLSVTYLPRVPFWKGSDFNGLDRDYCGNQLISRDIQLFYLDARPWVAKDTWRSKLDRQPSGHPVA